MGIGRRSFLRAAALGTGGVAFEGGVCRAAARAGSGRRPNVVFVFADQMRSQVLGCYGNRQVATPNLDRLAGEGARFDNAISTWPVCSPYRAMLLTGRYPMANGTVTNDTAPKDALPTIATVCKANGYDTGYIGKWHLEWNRDAYVPRDRRRGFEYWAVRNCSHQYFDSFFCGDTADHVPLPGYEPEGQTRLAAEYIRAHRRKPFCLFLSWGPPHDPYKAPDTHMRRFSPADIGLRANVGEKGLVSRLLSANPVKPGTAQAKRRAQWRRTLEDDFLLKQRCLQGYYASTTALDDCMGALMAAIDEAGLRDDTILVFSSDHGDMLGSHRMVSKQMPLEESISIPFILRYPRRVRPGTVTDALLGPMDVMPTLLGLAGLPCPPGLDGIDLAEAAMGGSSDQREALLIMKLLPGGNPWIANGVTEWRGVRTKQHTYTRLLGRGPWVLFDNLRDPYQLDNLVGRAEHRGLQQRLDALTTSLMAAAGDPGNTAAIVAYRQHRRQEALGGTVTERTVFRLRQGDTLARRDAPQIAGRSIRIEAVVEAKGGNGVVVAQGGIGSGYSLYLEDGVLWFATRHKGPLVKVHAPDRFPRQRTAIAAELSSNGLLTLAVNGGKVAEARGPGPIPKLPGDGLEVGSDALHSVAGYECPNTFQGVIHEVVITVGEGGSPETTDTE